MKTTYHRLILGSAGPLAFAILFLVILGFRSLLPADTALLLAAVLAVLAVMMLLRLSGIPHPWLTALLGTNLAALYTVLAVLPRWAPLFYALLALVWIAAYPVAWWLISTLRTNKKRNIIVLILLYVGAGLAYVAFFYFVLVHCFALNFAGNGSCTGM